ncbi:hypothetical protein AgCh_026231 [Apium graveolens]
MMSGEKSKIMIVGATGYLGTYMAKASVSLGHLTYAYVPPLSLMIFNPPSCSSSSNLNPWELPYFSDHKSGDRNLGLPLSP